MRWENILVPDGEQAAGPRPQDSYPCRAYCRRGSSLTASRAGLSSDRHGPLPASRAAQCSDRHDHPPTS